MYKVVIFLCLLLSQGIVLAQVNVDPERAAKLAERGYEVKIIGKEIFRKPDIKLPALDGYTEANILKKIDKSQKGRVSIRKMMGEDSLSEFTGGDQRIKLWLKLQRALPKAIFIKGGYMTIPELAQSVPIQYLNEVSPGVYHLKLPLVVENDATLHIDKSVKQLRLSTQRGSFIVNDGKMFITDTEVSAWDEKSKGYATLKKIGKNKFRPFILSWGGTETYFYNSIFHSLGYAGSKSYGISISQYSPGMYKQMGRDHPTGWIIGSKFYDMWYGFYCYEAFDFVLYKNEYIDNILYGIDPHDRSENLIIAHNRVHGTVKKHGIIISREVNHSWIFNNISYKNKLSGIVIDRSSIDNVVMYNQTFQNGSDGITIYESPNNIIADNIVALNNRHGVRIRNSVDVKLFDNEIVSNKLKGVYAHIKDLTGTPRDIDLDPFTQKVSILIRGGVIYDNYSGSISIDSPLSVELYDLKMSNRFDSNKSFMSGVLENIEDELMQKVMIENNPVVIQVKDK